MEIWVRLADRLRLPGSRPADWLIVGLGNPGPRYEGTRHNAGYRVVAGLAERHGLAWDAERHQSRLARGKIAEGSVVLAQPLTYVNESGRAVGPLSRELDLAPSRVIVVYDELDLPPGQIRLRQGGGAGGHRGMASILRALGTEEVPRLRIGIGRPHDGIDAVAYVLARLSDAEWETMGPASDRAVDALEAVVAEGLATAMSGFNRGVGTDDSDAA
ncbi:MAG: aminoacyl-tRNA hydrolase [Anaerolineae bacterium]